MTNTRHDEGLCEECETRGIFCFGTKTPAMTAYHWDGEGEDPNRDLVLCDECKECYREYWKGMWEEYYSSQG